MTAVLLTCALAAQEGPQLYNLSFDTWNKKNGVWYPFEKDAPASHRIWDSANPGLGAFGINTTTPEYEHVAVRGKGKAAARIESRKVAWAFISGSLYNGHFIRVVDLNGVETELGAQFSSRPRSLSGYYHYLPAKINHSSKEYSSYEGKSDEAMIEIILVDWDKPYRQNSSRDGFIDSENDPHIIGIASYMIKKGTSGYVQFEAPFKYRSSKTPRYAVFTITSSRLGGFGTGATGTVLYVDEFKFNY